jgi:hypothetical protein
VNRYHTDLFLRLLAFDGKSQGAVDAYLRDAAQLSEGERQYAITENMPATELLAARRLMAPGAYQKALLRGVSVRKLLASGNTHARMTLARARSFLTSPSEAASIVAKMQSAIEAIGKSIRDGAYSLSVVGALAFAAKTLAEAQGDDPVDVLGLIDEVKAAFVAKNSAAALAAVGKVAEHFGMDAPTTIAADRRGYRVVRGIDVGLTTKIHF